MIHSMSRTAILLVPVLLYAAVAGAGMPSQLAGAAKQGGLSEQEVSAVETEPLAWVYEDESNDRQVTVLGLVKVPASPKAITKNLLKREGLLKSEALRQIGVFGNPATPKDVAEFRMPESDLETLADCEVGDCKFKLGERGVERIHEVDWSKPDAREQVEALMRAGMFEFVRRYQTKGREALFEAVDKEEPQSFAAGADKLTSQLTMAKKLVPALREHLLHYPKDGMEGARDRIVWTVRDYGYRPVTSIVHSIVYEQPVGAPATLIALKTLYSSHYFQARQRLISLWVDPENPNRTYVGYSDRLLFDDDVGRIQRSMIEAGVVKSTTQRLETLRGEYQ